MYNFYIDGINGIGKTTMGNVLVKEYGYKRVKHRTVPKIANRWFMVLSYVFTEIFCSKTIFDRCWYSEYVYGQLYRKKSVLQIKDLLWLDKLAIRLGSSVHIFYVADLKRAEENIHERANADEHPYIPTTAELAKANLLYDTAWWLAHRRSSHFIEAYVSEYFEGE